MNCVNKDNDVYCCYTHYCMCGAQAYRMQQKRVVVVASHCDVLQQLFSALSLMYQIIIHVCTNTGGPIISLEVARNAKECH